MGLGSSVLTFQVAGDNWQGVPDLAVTVDGVSLGSSLVEAAHSLGQSQTISFLDNLSVGSHILTVTLSDPNYDGPGFAKDLYVEGATINGAPIPNSTFALSPTTTYSQILDFTAPSRQR